MSVTQGSNSGIPERIAESRESILQRELLGIYFWQKDIEKPAVEIKDLLEKLGTFTGKEKLEGLIAKYAKEDSIRLSMQAELWYKDNTDLMVIVNELFLSLEIEQIKSALINTIDRLRRAEGSGNESLIQKELSVCRELSEKLSQMKKKT